jgi:LacI family transcriptional regulator
MMAGNTRNPTQEDVARAAGVSQALVSYVLNDSLKFAVPEATRQRILNSARELGYVPNRAARNLRTRKTYTITCVIPDITNPFYPDFARGIQDTADERGYDLVLYNTDGHAEKEAKCLRAVAQGSADGVIGVFFHTNATGLAPLLTRGFPIVRLEATRKAAGSLPLDNIYVDSVAGARTAVTYLIERGHRRIAMISGQSGPHPARLRGYREALEVHGLAFTDELVASGDFRERGGYHAMQQLLALTPRPTAVFAANDEMAMGALLALGEAGVAVPGELAVVGFDDIPTARLTNPPLTTVAQFQYRLGRRAAELLLERLAGTAPSQGRSEELPYTLVVRGSA